MKIPKVIGRTAKALFTVLATLPFVRPVGLAAVRSLNRRSLRRLKATPGVLRVYFRGSFARGNFVPLASDVDLALLLGEREGRSYEALTRIHRSLRLARRWNPSLRDWWNHMILDTEWPTVEAFGALYGVQDWRDENGRPPFDVVRPLPSRLLAASSWAQLCQWSGSAAHAFIHGERIHNFRAGLKKSRTFALKLGLATAESLPSDEMAGLIGVFRALEWGAGVIAGGAGVPADGESIFRTKRAQFIVIPDGLDDAALRLRFLELRRRPWPEVRVTYLLPARALSIWPLPAETVLEGKPPPPMAAAVAREILLHEALYLPSTFRLAVASPDPRPRLAHAMDSLSRAVALYENREAPPATAEGSTVEALFAAGAQLCGRLQEALSAFAAAQKKAA